MKRGILFIWLEKYEKAKEEFEKAIKIDPNFVEAHYGLGISLILLECWDDAGKKFEEIKKIDPNFLFPSEAMLFVIYLIKAKIYLEKILEIMSKWPELLQKQQMVKEAEELNKIIKECRKEWESILSIKIDELLENFKVGFRIGFTLRILNEVLKSLKE